jgi:hypothetical protein
MGQTNGGLTIATAFGMALLLAGCGHGRPSSHDAEASQTGAGSTSAIAFSSCMRSHGLREFPDPDAQGELPKVAPRQLGASPARYDVAEEACQHLLQPSTAQARQTQLGMLEFARCMRSHGLPGWPDPTVDGSGQPVFDLRGRMDPDAPPASETADQCSHLLHPPAGQDGVVLCNGIGEQGCHHYGRPAG